MGSLAVDAISVLGTAVTAYSFLESLFPESSPQGATVEIRTSTGTDAANDVEGAEDTGGRIKRVWYVTETLPSDIACVITTNELMRLPGVTTLVTAFWGSAMGATLDPEISARLR